MAGSGDKAPLEKNEWEKSFTQSSAAEPEHQEHCLPYLCAALKGQAFGEVLVLLKKSGCTEHTSVRILASGL